MSKSIKLQSCKTGMSRCCLGNTYSPGLLCLSSSMLNSSLRRHVQLLNRTVVIPRASLEYFLQGWHDCFESRVVCCQPQSPVDGVKHCKHCFAESVDLIQSPLSRTRTLALTRRFSSSKVERDYPELSEQPTIAGKGIDPHRPRAGPTTLGQSFDAL